MREWAESTVAATADSEVIFEGRIEHQTPTSIDIIDLVNDPHAQHDFNAPFFSQ
jgi:hypothetical protein